MTCQGPKSARDQSRDCLGLSKASFVCAQPQPVSVPSSTRSTLACIMVQRPLARSGRSSGMSLATARAIQGEANGSLVPCNEFVRWATALQRVSVRFRQLILHRRSRRVRAPSPRTVPAPFMNGANPAARHSCRKTRTSPERRRLVHPPQSVPCCTIRARCEPCGSFTTHVERFGCPRHSEPTDCAPLPSPPSPDAL